MLALGPLAPYGELHTKHGAETVIDQNNNAETVKAANIAKADAGLLRRIVTGRAELSRFRVTDRIFDRLFALERRGYVDMSDPSETTITGAGRAALDAS